LECTAALCGGHFNVSSTSKENLLEHGESHSVIKGWEGGGVRNYKQCMLGNFFKKLDILFSECF
jgi:hypothetical protein